MSFKSAVYKLISSTSVDAANLFDIYYTDGGYIDTSLAIRDVNMFWRTELALLPHDTMLARLSLNDSCTPEQWAQLFRRDVVPAIVKYWLPTKLVKQVGNYA
jgi:hypothetical protein